MRPAGDGGPGGGRQMALRRHGRRDPQLWRHARGGGHRWGVHRRGREGRDHACLHVRRRAARTPTPGFNPRLGTADDCILPLRRAR
eukprot:1423414-Prymnesium_polylepis.3